MKTNLRRCAARGLALVAVLASGSAGFAPHALAQSSGGFQLTRAALVVVSGSSAGGTIQLSGGFSPAAAGPRAGGAYSLEGGFSEMNTVETLTAPALKISRTEGGFLLSWADPSTGFTLQIAPALGGTGSPVWIDVALPVDEVNGEKRVMVAGPAGPQQFYRLAKP